MKKIFILILVSTFLISCSKGNVFKSNDKSNPKWNIKNNTGSFTKKNNSSNVALKVQNKSTISNTGNNNIIKSEEINKIKNFQENQSKIIQSVFLGYSKLDKNGKMNFDCNRLRKKTIEGNFLLNKEYKECTSFKSSK